MYDKWSLDVLYTGFDDPKFQEEFQQLDEFIEKFKNLAESLDDKEPRTAAKEILSLYEEFRIVFFRPVNYCSLRQSVNTKDGESVSYLGRIIQKITKSPLTLLHWINIFPTSLIWMQLSVMTKCSRTTPITLKKCRNLRNIF